jgi:acetoin utilization deacetylase AcuC-like enzyme
MTSGSLPAMISKMRVAYTPNYYAEIGSDHVFPIRKFELVRDRLLSEGTLTIEEFIEPRQAEHADVRLVHSEDYVARLQAGELTTGELRRLGLPWSEGLVRRSFFAVGGTMLAAHCALEDGIASNLAGGTHHAFPDRGEGFCVLNDVAITIRSLQRDGLIRRAATVDCDVHQGDGTATIFANDETVFTFSIHGARNYPLRKANSCLDIALPDGATDQPYLDELERGLSSVFQHKPDIVFYLGGADPYVNDKLGRLALTINGLRTRDELVLTSCLARGLPIATVMSGGYAQVISDTVEIHCNTIRVAKKLSPSPLS